MIQKKLHYHKYLRLWFNWLMAIHNIFKQIAYESIHVLTISVKLQLGYVHKKTTNWNIVWYSDNYKFLELAMSLLDFSPRIPLGTFSILLKTSLEFRIEAKTHLSLHEVQVSYSYSASYVIVTMSHNSTSLKQLLLFLQYFKWREYEAPSTTRVFRFVLMFKQAYCRPGLWLIDPIYFPFPWNHYRDLNETILESSSSKMCLYF